MDADKLNEAAKHFAAWETINSSDPNNNYYCKWGFIKGADWLMQQPLADRLTDEEREKIKGMYNRKITYTDEMAKKYAEVDLLIAIFGFDFFKEN